VCNGLGCGSNRLKKTKEKKKKKLLFRAFEDDRTKQICGTEKEK